MTKSSYTKSELDQLRVDSPTSIFVIIHGKIYDLSEFEDHPGGMDILRDNSTGDATEAFEISGHSGGAREMMSRYYIGDYIEKESSPSRWIWSYKSGLLILGAAILFILIGIIRRKRSK
ncbi:MAG: Cytochrome b5 type B (outer mitochondrial membrane) [Marteilia pararefringens]